MTLITRNRTIRPSTRLETSKSYKIDTRAISGSSDTLVVNIDHESKPFKKTYSFSGKDLANKDSISFRVKDYGTHIDITWSGASPRLGSAMATKTVTNKKIEPNAVKAKPVTGLHKKGFKPIADSNSKVLVLGTMPGELSLAKQEYYAHPRNLFWKIIATVTGNEIPATYSDKKRLLLRSQIAVWDVCDVCLREGSLDSAIQQEVPNDIETFLKKHSSIKTIAFNGNKAAGLFDKYFTREAIYKYLTLPSTSPANAGLSGEKKNKFWIKITIE